MTFGLTPAGFQIKTLDEIRADFEVAQRADIDPALDVSDEALVGEFNGIIASSLRELWELGKAVYDARDPDNATHDALDGTAALTGAGRRPATYGLAGLEVQLTAGTTLGAGAIASVTGQPENRWVTRAPVTNSGGATAWLAVQADCEKTGPVQAPAYTIGVIATPSAGWTGVRNPLDAVPGRLVETDAELRLRREQELQGGGTSPLDAIRADLRRVPDVLAVVMYENTSAFPDLDGLPPHSIEAVVLGGDDQAIAEQLWRSRAGGVHTHSSNVPPTERTVIDSEGAPRVFRFTRPTVRSVWVTITLTRDAARYAGDAAVKAALVAWADANLSMGDAVPVSRLICAAVDVAGVRDVVSIAVGFAPNPTGTRNLVVGRREVVDLDTSRITVSSS